VFVSPTAGVKTFLFKTALMLLNFTAYVDCQHLHNAAVMYIAVAELSWQFAVQNMFSISPVLFSVVARPFM